MTCAGSPATMRVSNPSTVWSGSSTRLIVLPCRPFCPPGLRDDLGRWDARLARSARAVASSRDGGIDEFVEFFASWPSNSATRARNRSTSAKASSKRASNSAIRVTPPVYPTARVP